MLVKDKLLEAQKIFKGTGVQITSEGKRHLGAAIGSTSFRSSYVAEKVNEWVDMVKILAKIATTEPHAAFSALIHRIQCRWIVVAQTVPGLTNSFQPLDIIRKEFLPALLGREVSELGTRTI